MKRKSKKEKRVNVAFMIEPSMLKELDYYAEKIGISRSLMIRNCVNSSLDDLRIFEKSGLLRMAQGSANLLQVFKQARNLDPEGEVKA